MNYSISTTCTGALPEVRIARNKGLLKEYQNRTVYLENGDEYQIQIFNPSSSVYGCDISIDGKGMGKTLIVRPGERIWLDRFLGCPRKLKFGTYEVSGEAAMKAISENGNVTVSFYKEKTPVQIICEPYVNPLNNPYQPWWKPGQRSISDAPYDQNIVYCSSASSIPEPSNCALGVQTAFVETGRTVMGSESSQKFSESEYDLETFSCGTAKIKILPISCKPVHAEDLKKRYCAKCGRRVNPKHKYCPYCGAKINE